MYNSQSEPFLIAPDFSCPEPISQYLSEGFSSTKDGQSTIIRDTSQTIVEVIDAQLEDRIFWIEEGSYFSMDIVYDLCRPDTDSDERYLMVYSVENPKLSLWQKLPINNSAELPSFIKELKSKFIAYVQDQSLEIQQLFDFSFQLLSRRSGRYISVKSLDTHYEFPYVYENGELTMLETFPYRWWKWNTEKQAVELFLQEVVLPGIFVTQQKIPFLGLGVIDISSDLKCFMKGSKIELHNR